MRTPMLIAVLAACGSKPPPAPTPAAQPAAPTQSAAPAKVVEAPPDDDVVRAVRAMNEDDPRSVEAATKAATTLGEEHRGLDALQQLALRPISKRGVRAQIEAIRAIGRFDGNDAAAEALVPLLVREGPPRPAETPPGGDLTKPDPAVEDYTLYLAVTGSAINASAELHSPRLVEPLLEAMYRNPELFTQTRRALVACGPTAETALRKVLRGDDAGIAKLFAERKLDRACDDAQHCRPISAREFYSVVVLGDFHDPTVVPELLALLKQPALPSYYFDGDPGPSTQHTAVFDALRRIGAPDAAAPMRAIWTDAKADPQTRSLAAATYALVTRDTTGVDALGKIAADNNADDQLRQEAATAYARLSTNVKDIVLLQNLAQRYLDASAKKAKEAAPLRRIADAADRQLAPVKAAAQKAREEALRIAQDQTSTVDQIKAATQAAQIANDDLREAIKKHKVDVGPFRALDNAAKAYLGYARMFQTHIARIEVAARCQADVACLAATLSATGDAEAAKVAPYIKDVASWTAEEKQALAGAAIERAAIELGKLGTKASEQTGALLDAAANGDLLVRSAILLALPHVAKLPCTTCETKLDALAHTTDVDSESLRIEAAVLRNYFHWAGKQ